jgi:hypothetical protein
VTEPHSRHAGDADRGDGSDRLADIAQIAKSYDSPLSLNVDQAVRKPCVYWSGGAPLDVLLDLGL